MLPSFLALAWCWNAAIGKTSRTMVLAAVLFSGWREAKYQVGYECY